MTRTGAALILALVLLAALMLMGLPFLFIQSASVGGARSLAAQQQARQAAEGLAVYAQDIGARTIQGHLGTATAAWSSLPLTVNGTPSLTGLGLGASSSGATLVNRIELTGLPADAAIRQGVWIEDEQGKLDANRLGPMGWKRLFDQLGIPDWDDSQVEAAQRIAVGYKYTTVVPPNPPVEHARDDNSPAGQLADGIARLRSMLGAKGQHLTKLEDLLQIDPNKDPFTEHVPPSLSWGIFRKPLTPGELERLRPHLTFHALAQARAGLIDNGSVLMVHPAYQNQQSSDGIGSVLDDWMITDDGTTTIEFYARVFGGSLELHAVHSGSIQFHPGQPRTIGITATVNLHQATPQVRAWLQGLPAWTGMPTLSRGDMGTQWPFSQPQRGNFAYPQVDTVSLGWFTVEARTQEVDRSGQPLARAATRRTVQALPHEGRVERRWLSQGDLEHTARSRAFSRVVTWPHPVNRLSDTSPSALPKDGDHDPAAGVDFSDAGLTAAPIAPATTLTTDWYSYFGGNAPTIMTAAASATAGAATHPPMTTGSDPVLALRPDGIDVGPTGAKLAYLAQLNGPLRPFSATVPEMAGRTLEFWVRPDAAWAGIVPLLDLRSHLDQLGRTLGAAIGTWAAIDQGSTDRQNHLGLYYDRSQEMLVLVHAPPTVERLASIGSLLNADNPATPTLDERSLSTAGFPLIMPQLTAKAGGGWTTQALTPLWLPNRILHCYATPGGFLPGQWHRIQVVLGNGRPGNMALLVDGCAGRLVNHIPASDPTYAVAWGDQCTLPALVLDEDLPAIDRTKSALVGPDSTFRLDLKVAIPAFVAKKAGTLTLADLIPARGCLLIDDEHLRYENVAPASGQLTSVHRGVRQDSVIGSPDLFKWSPGSQKHAKGTPMLADGWRARTDATNDRLFSGATTLRSIDPAIAPIALGLGDDILTSGSPIRGTIRATLAPDTNLVPDPDVSLLTTITMSSMTPAGEWPIRGVVYIDTMGYFAFVRSKTAPLEFTFSLLAHTGTNPLLVCPDQANARRTSLTTPTYSSYDPDSGFTCYLASVEIDPATNPADEGVLTTNDMVGSSFDPMVQITSPNHVEWIRYWVVIDQAQFPLPGGSTDRAAFLVFQNHIRAQHRAQVRTAWAGHPDCAALGLPAFTHGAQVVPVQNRQYLGRWAQDGDLVTLIPRLPGTNAKPLALPIRMVAMDGYLAPNATALPAGPDTLFAGRCDTVNGWFAFDRGISSHPEWALNWQPNGALRFSGTQALSLAAVDLVSGTAWSSADDLSPTGPNVQPTSYLPRIDWCHQSGTIPASGVTPVAVGGADGGLFLGNTDISRPGDSTVMLTQGTMTIDAIAAGAWAGHTTGSNGGRIATVLRWVSGGTVTDTLPATGGLGTFAVLSTPVCNANRIPSNSASMPLLQSGLIRIDGEVFAWFQPTSTELTAVQTAIAETADQGNANINQTIKIVGRGLLGSERRAHTIGPNAPDMADNRGHRPGLWALMLPFGPVGMLAIAPTPPSNSAGEWWELSNGITQNDWIAGVPHRWTGFPEGFALVTKAEPDATDLPELLRADRNPWDLAGPAYDPLINPNYERYMPAAWLRGLYRTSRQDWGARITQGVLLIPWQPRYPSALPFGNPVANDGLAADVIWNAAMRSRYYSWAGFPLRLHDLRFPTTGAASIARSGAGTFLKMLDDCSTATTQTEVFFLARLTTDPKRIQSWPAAGTTNLGTPDAVFGAYGQDKPTDGGELRVTWRYTRNLADLTLANQVEIYRALAEGANRTPAIANVTLRGYAPCTTLAVEDAR